MTERLTLTTTYKFPPQLPSQFLTQPSFEEHSNSTNNEALLGEKPTTRKRIDSGEETGGKGPEKTVEKTEAAGDKSDSEEEDIPASQSLTAKADLKAR